MVRFSEISPAQRLQPYVRMFWLLEQDASPAPPQRIVPDGHCELILNWEQPCAYLNGAEWQRQSQSFFAGQIDGPLMLRPTGRTKTLGVSFHPDGAAALLHPSVAELSGKFTPLEDLSPVLHRKLRSALEMPNPIAAVEEALLPVGHQPQYNRDRIVQEALEKISASSGQIQIHRLACDLGLSVRQFERRFSAAVGLAPKSYGRILRFNRVFHHLEEPQANWAQLAAECGYFDQAHLIRDCRTLAGTTPRILTAQDGDLARHFYRRFEVSHSYNAKPMLVR